MADNDRWRNDEERYRSRDEDRRRSHDEDDWGYPRSGRGEYGGRGSWFAGGNGDYRPDDRGGPEGGGREGRGAFGASEAYGNARREREREDYRGDFRGRGRDYGDSAGYGGGGSARDWRDVEGYRGGGGGGGRSGREPGFTDLAFGSGFGSGYEGRDRSGRTAGWETGNPGPRGRGRDERGFFERAGDEIASWFGDDDASRRRHQDERSGEHRGRGPKGYQRSDERIRDDVNDRLTEDPHIDASEIDVSVSSREVTLSGTVRDRFSKRHAEDIAESVSGVAHVQNNLRVRQSAGSTEGLTTGGTGSGSGSGSGFGSGSSTASGGGLTAAGMSPTGGAGTSGFGSGSSRSGGSESSGTTKL